jgi:hypothetical protein
MRRTISDVKILQPIKQPHYAPNKVKKTTSHLALNYARITTLECMDLCQEYGIDKLQTLQLSIMTMHHFMLE